MKTYSVYLPDYTIGAGDVYEHVPSICRTYGTKVVLIGGKTALEKAEQAIRDGIAGSDLEITKVLWYGGDATMENVSKLVADPDVQAADMLFGVGGGRAVDTVKCVGQELHKPIFTFPTIASNCAPVTKVSVVYHDDHTFKGLEFVDTPPKHTFINTKIIGEAPTEYIWAGIGDALSKEFESSFSARGVELNHTDQVGVDVGQRCAMPLLRYGRKALDDISAGKTSHELSQVILNIIVTTGLVSVLVDNDFNSAVAHAIYYGSTVLPEPEDKPRLHGQVVAYGVLVQLALDEQYDKFEEVYAFNKSIGLPTCLADISAEGELKDMMLDHTVGQKDLARTPYEVTREKLEKAVAYIEEYHKNNG